MEMIAPMAKILAEANGIDWRSIQGSGEDGTIVEQDILNYLMRVMNGEEEPPSTPVDEPPPDWTGEMPPMPSMEMMAQAGIESDITDFVASSSKPAASPVHSVPGTVPAGDLDQDAMDFELDDDLTPDLGGQDYGHDAAAQDVATQPVLMDHPAFEAEPVSAPSPAFVAPVEEEAPAQLEAFQAPVAAHEAPMDVLEGAPDTEVVLAPALHAEDRRMDDVAAPSAAPFTPAAVEPVQPFAASAATPEPQEPATQPGGFGLGGLLSRLYKRKDAPAEPQHTEVAPTSIPAAPVAAPYQAHVEESPVFEAVAQQDTIEQPMLGAPVEAAPVESHVEEYTASAPLVADPVRDEQVLEAEPAPLPATLEAEAPVVEAVREPEPEPVFEPEPVEAAHEAPIFEPEPVHHVTPEPTTLVVAPIPAPEPVVHEAVTTPAPVVPAAVAHQSLGARQGVHLRLTVDTRALDEAGSHLGDHLGHAVPAEVLVARAAARQLGQLGFTSVGVAHLGDTVSARASRALHGADFRAAVHEYHAGELGDWADLMVVDAGQLGMDELHLLGDLATLSLGRHEGDRAALTLTGAVNAQAGAAFLQGVADLLQTPIKLLF